jgi:hypothetical protein
MEGGGAVSSAPPSEGKLRGIGCVTDSFCTRDEPTRKGNQAFTPAEPLMSLPQALTTPPPTQAAMPAVAAARAASAASTPPAAPTAPPPQAPIVVQLQVDGQTLASAVHRADKDTATRSFSPVPSY